MLTVWQTKSMNMWVSKLLGYNSNAQQQINSRGWTRLIWLHIWTTKQWMFLKFRESYHDEISQASPCYVHNMNTCTIYVSRLIHQVNVTVQCTILSKSAEIKYQHFHTWSYMVWEFTTISINRTTTHALGGKIIVISTTITALDEIPTPVVWINSHREKVNDFRGEIEHNVALAMLDSNCVAVTIAGTGHTTGKHNVVIPKT